MLFRILAVIAVGILQLWLVPEFACRIFYLHSLSQRPNSQHFYSSSLIGMQIPLGHR
jgi:hypothetical protein